MRPPRRALPLLGALALLALPAAAWDPACAAPGCGLWNTAFGDWRDELGGQLLVSPDGERLHVAYGYSATSELRTLDPRTGAQLWNATPLLPNPGWAMPWVASPSGRVLFGGTGSQVPPWPGVPLTARDPSLHALDARTGELLWRTQSPTVGHEELLRMVVSPDGLRLYATGFVQTTVGEPWLDIFTAAFDARTGHRLWYQTYQGPGQVNDIAWGIATSADGQRVFVIGDSYWDTWHGVTLAYSAATGQPIWSVRTDPGGPGHLEPEWLLVADGRVVVAGPGGGGARTVARDAATGALLWQHDYKFKNYDYPRALAASPAGDEVYIAVSSPGNQMDWATLAYDAASGAVQWVQRYDGPLAGHDEPFALAPSPDGTRVHVAGFSQVPHTAGFGTQFNATVRAHDAATGALLWSTLTEQRVSYEVGLAASPDGARLFAGASFWNFTNQGDVRAFALRAQAATPPSAPRDLDAAGSPPLLTWQPPAEDGGAPVAGYKVYRGTTSANLALVATLPPGATSYTGAPLTLGPVWHFTVAAANAHGEGPRAAHACLRGAGLPALVQECT